MRVNSPPVIYHPNLVRAVDPLGALLSVSTLVCRLSRSESNPADHPLRLHLGPSCVSYINIHPPRCLRESERRKEQGAIGKVESL